MQSLLNDLKKIGIVEKREIILRSGETSHLYCDVRKVFGFPQILNDLADAIGKKIPNEVTCIAASGYGGLPLGAIVASRFNLKFIGVRSEIKTHGKNSLLAGYIPTINDVIVIIDDVLTTGSSINETFAGLQKETEAKILSAIVAVKRGNPELGIPYSFLFQMEELLNDVA